LLGHRTELQHHVFSHLRDDDYHLNKDQLEKNADNLLAEIVSEFQVS
jgi:hypothetical protein